MLLIFYLWFYLVVGLKTHGLAIADPLGFHSKEYWFSETEANMRAYMEGINAHIYESGRELSYMRIYEIQMRICGISLLLLYMHACSLSCH